MDLQENSTQNVLQCNVKEDRTKTNYIISACLNIELILSVLVGWLTVCGFCWPSTATVGTGLAETDVLDALRITIDGLSTSTVNCSQGLIFLFCNTLSPPTALLAALVTTDCFLNLQKNRKGLPFDIYSS